jgi:CubicO group peptidase (beta-lactamase class C family)
LLQQKLIRFPPRCYRASGFALSAYLLRLASIAVMGLVCGAHAHAQNAALPVALTTEELGALFDHQVPREMEKAGVAGSAIVVVKDGSVLLARGYGYADIEHATPVSPSTTLFRVASISKVVTYTAVMQLVEQGKIDLDSDIARYLDFPIPATFAQPITMRNLMSHTAGFEDTVRGRWVQPGQLESSRDYLALQMPKRIFAPGKVPAYSSYGTTLAGYIVERVSGEPFETYVERHIFSRLGMRHSSFAQPLPPGLAPMLAKGYDTRSGPARALDTAQIAAATSMSSSTLDMARFMLAHLGGRALPGPAVLMSATLAQMHAVQFRHHPTGPGNALGLFEMDEVAPRLMGHTGDIPGFHSGMYLWPDQRIGLFIVQNTGTGPGMRNALLKSFAGRYLAPSASVAAMPRRVIAGESEQIQGSYRVTRRFESSPLSLKLLLDQSVVRMVSPGTIVIDTHSGSSGKPVEWHQIDSGVWQNAENPFRRQYFRKNAQGGWEMSSNRSAEQIWQKSPWHQHKLLILFVLPGAFVIVLPSLLAWPLTALLRRRRPQSDLSPALLKLRNCMRLAGLLTLSPWVLYAGIGLIVANDLLFIATPAFPILLRAVQVLAWLAVAATIGAIWAASVSWRTRQASWLSRAHQALFLLACLGAATMAWQGGLLVWNGKF